MAEWISAVANLALMYIAYKALGQIKEMKTQSKNDAVDQLYTRMFEIQKMMVEQPNIANYLSGTIDDAKCNIYLEMYADFIEQIVLQVDLLPSDAKIAWECYICDTLKKYTKLSDYVKKHLERKSSHLSEKIQKYINQENPCYKK